ncbi:hypothetical protein PP301_gp125 [Gordonia phage GMA2]|uniref:TROVE domain-containing protein n=1 Tax=Gordonia phage GMA2 TaxID=1647283 RepID=A0A0K0N779_9CAUD|nr:hypothetical protein PP301_gp125 [Gordonia phage GMA2]AKJ72597.1 hypothetical protein GMA2_59 [Gordonia phage GMA2]
MADALRSISTRTTPQTEAARSDQVVNNAGGFVFKLTPKSQLRRFLILGVDGGTYYQRSQELAVSNAKTVVYLAETNPKLVISEIKEVAEQNLAPRANPLLFALAIVSAPDINKDASLRAEALRLLPTVARTSTQLFTFIEYAQQFRGWGVSLREAVSYWYLDRSPQSAAYQIVKYRQRNGWTHRDVLRKAHPVGTGDFKPLFDYTCGRYSNLDDLPDSLKQIKGFEAAKTAPTRHLPELIKEYNLTWEMLPTAALNEADVWRALIDSGMPYTATMRQLSRLTQLNVLQGSYLKKVVATLIDKEKIQKSGVHPMNILFAMTTYASGRGFRGSTTWRPERAIVDTLDNAFYTAFKNVKPSGKRHMLALDVSGSMMSPIMNSNLSAREGSVAMALITAATEPETSVYGFTTGARGSSRFPNYYDRGSMYPLDLSPRRRLDDNVRAVSGLPFCGTDCALPMQYAKKNGLEIDHFVVYTDNETWAGSEQPFQALRKYRESSGINAKLTVVGMTATEFSIADPSDPGMLDVVGFDASAPAVISNFAAGDL